MPFVIACMVISAGASVIDIATDLADIMSAKKKIAKLRKQRGAE